MNLDRRQFLGASAGLVIGLYVMPKGRLWAAQPERAVIAEGLKSRGASDLMIPKVLVHLDEIPLLGSGKTDYVTLTRISIEGANG